MLDITSSRLARTVFLQNNVPLRVRRSPYTNIFKLSRRKFFIIASSPKEHQRGWQPVGMKKVLQVWTTVETQKKEIKEQWWELTFWFRLDMPLNPYRTLQTGRWLLLQRLPLHVKRPSSSKTFRHGAKAVRYFSRQPHCLQRKTPTKTMLQTVQSSDIP